MNAFAQHLGGVRLDAFIKGYFDCAFWTEEENLPEYFGMCHLFTEDREKMESTCEMFFLTHNNLWKDDSIAGHDFWLSRNGHGAGFFDNKQDNYGEYASFLQQKAREYGEDYTLYDYYKE